jgi:hypothetical protein
MASGHVNRVNRPNTWLHRPMLQNVKKALANSEPSTHGTIAKCRLHRGVSEFEVPAQSVDATQALNLSAGVSEKTRKEVTPILDSRERKLNIRQC